MELHAANDPPGSDYAIEALLLATLIAIALFGSCVLTWKAIAWLRNRRKSDGVAADGEQKPYAPAGFGRALGLRIDPQRMWVSVARRPGVLSRCSTLLSQPIKAPR
jgi:hypothetical protein